MLISGSIGTHAGELLEIPEGDPPERDPPELTDRPKRNAVTTATQLRTHRFLGASPHAMTLSRAIMGEVVNVARAKGLTVPEGTVDTLIEQVGFFFSRSSRRGVQKGVLMAWLGLGQCTSVKEGLPSSMMFDYLAGRPMEVEVRRRREDRGEERSSSSRFAAGYSGDTAAGGVEARCSGTVVDCVSGRGWRGGRLGTEVVGFAGCIVSSRPWIGRMRIRRRRKCRDVAPRRDRTLVARVDPADGVGCACIVV